MSRDTTSIQTFLKLVVRTMTLVIVLAMFTSGNVFGFPSATVRFWFYTAILTLHSVLEIWMCGRAGRPRWLVAPPVLTTGIVFLLNLGPTNLLFLRDSLRVPFFDQYGLTSFLWPSYSLFVAVIALVALWTGFDAGSSVTSFVANSRQYQSVKRYFRDTFAFNNALLAGIVGLSIIARILLILSGGYGYTQQLTDSVARYSRYLRLAGNLGLVALMVTSFRYFLSDDNSFRNALIVGVIVAVEIIFGFMSGFKSSVVTPLILLGAVYYIVYEKFPIRYLIYSAIAIFIAYSVIEPFRTLYKSGKFGEMDSPTQIINALVSTVSERSNEPDPYTVQPDQPVYTQFALRTNMTVQCSVALRVASTGTVDHKGREFRRYIALSPVYAYVPRAVWPGKPSLNPGGWFVSRVLDYEGDYNIGFTAIGFLYIAGGIVGVILGFMVVGIVQRFWYDIFFMLGAGGLVVYLGTIVSLVRLKSSLHGLPVHLLRAVPLMIILQYFLLKDE